MINTLFADSGGTGTDWIYIDAKRDKIVFETESYHPANWGDSFWERIESYWKSNQNLLEYNLRFFGSGCLNTENANLLCEKFQSFGFKDVNVKSDLHAAGFACYPNVEGSVIISGTGSVLFHYDKGEVSNVVGGKGHEIGDEGSGFYFGRLIIEKHRNGTLTEAQLNALNEKIDLLALANLKIAEAKYEWASLSEVLKDDQQLFQSIHKENINCFIKTHFTAGVEETVCLVGSYAYYHKELWIAELSSVGCKVESVILKPIEYFIE